ncbi:hypothetical protein GCM10011499_15500 [Pelagibacterium lentulum]|uniref:Uncharacterized protein n=1 Tax=Pelagibacterium lentulum TaxID=2029865 RepID=A0A916R9P7_9HYPH|nr:hypothetical protein GCM10011499_15500 [Pelagibacterium lentulum]
MAVCFLWHFPWGRPRRALPGTVFSWSPDFPLRVNAQRPPGQLVTTLMYGGWRHPVKPVGAYSANST